MRRKRCSAWWCRRLRRPFSPGGRSVHCKGKHTWLSGPRYGGNANRLPIGSLSSLPVDATYSQPSSPESNNVGSRHRHRPVGTNSCPHRGGDVRKRQRREGGTKTSQLQHAWARRTQRSAGGARSAASVERRPWKNWLIAWIGTRQRSPLRRRISHALLPLRRCLTFSLCSRGAFLAGAHGSVIPNKRIGVKSV
jgi:hypothetical protein